ncbi:MAG: hypothetical protein GXW85_13360 [Clostridia bacterium]|nr:hypothetical protein [Clostridia bacterium]
MSEYMKLLKKEIDALTAKMSEKLVQQEVEFDELVNLWLELQHYYLDTAADSFKKLVEEHYPAELEQVEILDRIEANSVVIEVIDKNTRQLFRRILPLDYLETDNGIVLYGETVDGQPTQIAFLSDLALSKINDVQGKGLDKPRCKDH